MSTFDNPFDPTRRLHSHGCSCGRHVSEAEHDTAAQLSLQPAVAASDEARFEGVVASAVMRAMFPQDVARRAFLKSVGAATAVAAVSQFFPLQTATEVFAQGGPLEKKDLKVGFIPITCATPIIMAAPMGFYAKNGLNVEVIKTAGWAVIRDKTINKEYDAAHMLSPMPLAITMGVGSNPLPYTMPAVENINGQAITLAMKHKDKRNPKDWKGFKFAVPFDFSMHNYLLRYYLAEHGLDPDVDVQIRSVPPPEMVANLRAENIDGYLGPDPMNQRAVYDGVGFIHILTKDIWEGHPCCAFAASKEFVTSMPNTYARAAEVDHRGHRVRARRPRTASRSPKRSRRRTTSTSRRSCWSRSSPAPSPTASAISSSSRTASISTRSRGSPLRLDHDADEALGPDQGRRRLRRCRIAGLSRHRHHQA